jgi:hypothetical protein
MEGDARKRRAGRLAAFGVLTAGTALIIHACSEGSSDWFNSFETGLFLAFVGAVTLWSLRRRVPQEPTVYPPSQLTTSAPEPQPITLMIPVERAVPDPCSKCVDCDRRLSEGKFAFHYVQGDYGSSYVFRVETSAFEPSESGQKRNIQGRIDPLSCFGSPLAGCPILATVFVARVGGHALRSPHLSQHL